MTSALIQGYVHTHIQVCIEQTLISSDAVQFSIPSLALTFLPRLVFTVCPDANIKEREQQELR